ncbi:MAG: alginate export family protein [Phocaeicola sp.]
MKGNNILAAIVVIVLFSCITLQEAKAQSLSLSLNQRNRAEYSDGNQGVYSSEPGSIILNSTRLTTEFANDLLKASITLQNSGSWGLSNSNSSKNDLVIFEAYTDIKLTKGVSTKVGRQMLIYDDVRILACPPWSFTGVSHDALLFKYTTGAFTAHLGGAYNTESGHKNNGEAVYSLAKDNWYQRMFYTWFNYKFSKHLTASAIYLNEGLQETTYDGTKDSLTHHRHTLGLYTSWKFNQFDATASFYQQLGKSITGKKLGGNMWTVKANYQFHPSFKLTAGWDSYSEAHKEKAGFTWLYGAAHIYGGFMDYWLDALGTVNGLNDLYLGCSGKIKKLSYTLDGHYLGMKSERNAGDGKSLGTEIDLVLKHPLNSWVDMELGLCGYFMTDASRTIKKTERNFGTFCYFTLTVQPSAFKSLLSSK